PPDFGARRTARQGLSRADPASSCDAPLLEALLTTSPVSWGKLSGRTRKRRMLVFLRRFLFLIFRHEHATLFVVGLTRVAWRARAEGDPAARGANELDHLGDLGGHRARRHQVGGRKLQIAPLAEQRLEGAAQRDYRARV